MPEEAKIEAVDIYTIFANALDNAIEALADAGVEKKWMKLELSHQGNIIFLRFVNPVETIPVTGKTAKADKINHGFGLKNIRLAVEKYHGEDNVINTWRMKNGRDAENGKKTYTKRSKLCCRWTDCI